MLTNITQGKTVQDFAGDIVQIAQPQPITASSLGYYRGMQDPRMNFFREGGRCPPSRKKFIPSTSNAYYRDKDKG
jgi:hypothetical protein